MGFRAEKIDPVRYKDFVVSSTRIGDWWPRAAWDEAGALLGQCCRRHGGEGRRPRPNDRCADCQCAERERADSAQRRLRDHGTVEGVVYPSVTNIGLRPTFQDVVALVIEAHLLGVDRDIRGRRVRLGFVQRAWTSGGSRTWTPSKPRLTPTSAAPAGLFDRLGVTFEAASTELRSAHPR